MRLARRCAIAVALAFTALPALAERPAALAMLHALEGDWRGAGEVNGMAADLRMRWERALEGKFHRLSMENLMTGQDGRSWRFEAEAYYRVMEDGSVTGQWFDSRGYNLPLTGRADADGTRMSIDWGTESSPERGRSTYRLEADVLTVIDEVRGKDGTLSVFGRTRLTRQ